MALSDWLRKLCCVKSRWLVKDSGLVEGLRRLSILCLIDVSFRVLLVQFGISMINRLQVAWCVVGSNLRAAFSVCTVLSQLLIRRLILNLGFILNSCL